MTTSETTTLEPADDAGDADQAGEQSPDNHNQATPWAAIADQIRPATYLAAPEREFYFRYDPEAGHLVVTAFEKGVARRLVRHPEFRVERVHVHSGAESTATVDRPQDVRDRTVWGVEGVLPTGCLKVPKHSRAESSPATIVSKGVYQEGSE